MQHILILGGGYAGLLSALRLQPRIKQNRARVTLVNASDTFTERIRMHQLASGQALKRYHIPAFLKGTGIDFVQGTVRHINPDDQQVTLDDTILEYDILMVALGSVVDRDRIDGIRDHAYTLDKVSVEKLREQRQSGRRLLVIGGGLTGIEAASEFAQQADVDVRLVTGGAVGESVSDKGRDHIRNTLSGWGVTIHEHVTVNALHADHADSSAGRLDYDLCLWAGGFRAVPVIAESGFAVNEHGQMRVRDTLQSLNYDNVYGIGDAASVIMDNGNRLRMACAVAMPMGAHGADNVASMVNGQPLQPFRFAYALQCISLGRRNALVQMVHADDMPKDRIFTGRLGAFIKEMICRYTVFSLQLEKRLPGSYMYPKGLPATSQTIPVTQA